MQMAEEKKKNRAAVTLGRLGGKQRAANLSAEDLSAQGKKAAAAMWASPWRTPTDAPGSMFGPTMSPPG